MPSMVFDVVCSAEKKRIAELELPSDKLIERDDIVRGFRPVAEVYAVLDRSGRDRAGSDGEPIIKDGTQLVCPHCFNPVLVTEPDGDKGVYLAPGNFRTGKA